MRIHGWLGTKNGLRHSWRGSLVATALVAVLVAAVLALTGCAASPSPKQGPQTVPSGKLPTSDETNEFAPGAALLSKVVVYVEIQSAFTSPNGTTYVPIGNGSGIVLRSDGYILTNDHVVKDADRVVVTLGPKHVTAKVVGRDPFTDLAVIKVDSTGLAPAVIGDSSKLKVGQWVLAVGSPFGLSHSVSAGIVSALDRDTFDPQPKAPAAYTNLIQTDAAINPGNSGGALGTLDGKVVGVNSITESPSGVNAGVGFAIPIDFAVSVADQLIKTGHAVHPYIGATVIDVDAHVAAELGLPASADRGALVQRVAPKSPAARAGLAQDDVITSLAGQAVTDGGSFWSALSDQKSGTTIPVVIIRNGKPMTLRITIGSGAQG
jgi:S1-C subfamily serine protease